MSSSWLRPRALLLALVLCAGCGARGSVAPPPDAGPDEDAGPDAGPPVVWQPFTDIPDTVASCGLEWADPAFAAFLWRWVPCGGGASCERLVLPEAEVSFVFPGVSVGGTAYAAASFQASALFDGGEPTHEFLALLSDDGPRLAVRRRLLTGGSGGCIVGRGTVAMGERSFLLGIVAWAEGLSPSAMEPMQLFLDRVDADWSDPRGEPSPELSLRAARRFWLSDDALFYDDMGQELLDLSNQAAGALPLVGGEEAFVVERLTWGPDAFWLEAGVNRLRYAHGTLGGAPTDLFLEVPGVDLGGLSTDGADLVWWQGFGPACFTPPACNPFDRVELWTAPFTASRSELAPRRVGEIRTLFLDARVADGRIAFSQVLPGFIPADGTAPREIWVVDLESGEVRIQGAPPGHDRPYAWALDGEQLTFRANRGDGEHLFRVRIDELPVRTPEP